MSTIRHKVAGVYADREQARTAMATLREGGFDGDRLALVDARQDDPDYSDPGAVAEEAGRDLTRGAGAGAGIGAAGGAALAVAEVAVVAAAPVLAVVLGAGLGAAAGTAYANVASSRVSEPDFRQMVSEAVKQGYAVLVAHADSEAEALKAQDLFSRTAAEQSFDQHGGTA